MVLMTAMTVMPDHQLAFPKADHPFARRCRCRGRPQASACLNASSISASYGREGCVVGIGERACDGGNDVSAHPGYRPVRGGAEIVGTEEGKDGPVARRNREYARCEVCHTVSLNVRVSRYGKPEERKQRTYGIESSCAVSYRDMPVRFPGDTLCSENCVYVGG
jgi:hypothetical protein